MIYDRPVYELMRDAAAQLTPPFAVGDFVAWFAEHYPKINPSTVQAHVAAMTVDNPSRRHHPSLAARAPLFFRSAQGLWSVSIRMSTSTRKHPWPRTAA